MTANPSGLQMWRCWKCLTTVCYAFRPGGDLALKPKACPGCGRDGDYYLLEASLQPGTTASTVASLKLDSSEALVREEEVGAVDRVEELDEALRDILCIVGGWSRPLSDQEKLSYIGEIAQAAYYQESPSRRGGEAVSRAVRHLTGI